MEACGPSGWINDLAKSHSLKTLVCSTNEDAWKWSNVKRKTDKDDAPKLARMAAMNELKPVHMPSEDRFTNGRQVSAYFGLVPRQYQSGETDRNGRITKRGKGKVACSSSKQHASHNQKRPDHPTQRCLNRVWITEGMQPAHRRLSRVKSIHTSNSRLISFRNALFGLTRSLRHGYSILLTQSCICDNSSQIITKLRRKLSLDSENFIVD